ncbi:DUF5020 family protein [Polaribacter sp. NJDZ03]|uniref:DUF5020 family protein n=1 Tax=Polaribacter sp. NJDZ03 TaxID=2855841 RepID=UPI001C49FD2B|nr:DUF5020 family protein [Polaribacter sp. NJDZ03]
MKKITTLFALFTVVTLSAQNFQSHYDLAREHVTLTFEMFKPDNYGNTYTFTDFDFNADNGISQAYFEIARVLKTEKMPVGLHIEYNGGLGTFERGTGLNGYTINNAWIFGANYGKSNAVWGFSTYAGYKTFKGTSKGNFQTTGTWYWNIIANKLTFSGFADLWSENGLSDKTVFLSEPQLWYHLNKTFSVGGELELSNNFAGTYAFKGRPTLAVKWNL